MIPWLAYNFLLILLDAPILFAVVWAFFSLLVLLGALELWFEPRSVERLAN